MEHLKTFENAGDFIDFLNKDKNKLFELRNDTLIVYAIRIEKDIQKKLNIDCMYTSYSNGATILLYVLSNYSFETVRNIKKYFLDTIPHVTTVEFDDDGFSVKLTRSYGLETLIVNESD